jgi:(p)ppGpp synthase/HD superfamily hydrolase
MTASATDNEFTARLEKRLHNAFVLASLLHGAQRRKGSDTPYIAHLMAVCSLVLEAGGSEDQAIAALLHDSVEDQGGAPMLDAIRVAFGDEVANIVKGCTDTDEAHKPSWRPRKERFLVRVPDMSYDVRLVVTADKLHNVRSILADYRQYGEELWPRFTGKKDGTLWYYATMTRLLMNCLRPDETNLRNMTEELQRNVAELMGLAGLPDLSPGDSYKGT